MQCKFDSKTSSNGKYFLQGFYAENHGVLGKSMYDSEQGKVEYGYDMYHYNESIMPIWITNQLSGKYSGCMMWPGHEFEYGGVNCTFSVPFNKTSSWNRNVDKALSWFIHPKTPVNLAMMYVNQPDSKGHAYGPQSNKVSTNESKHSKNIIKNV